MNDKNELETKEEKWVVYVDETYLNNMHRIVTSFWAINQEREGKVFSKYREVVYSTGIALEAKSNVISDDLNTRALATTKRHAAKCVISDLDISSMDSNIISDQKFKTAVQIYSYLLPVNQILQQIKRYRRAGKISVSIVIDYLSNLADGSTFSKYAEYFLQQIGAGNSTDKIKFSLSWGMIDSRKSIGIQIADLICGAYRKDLAYQQFQPDLELIPFSYEFFHPREKILENKDFLQTYSLLQLMPQPKLKVVEEKKTTQTQPISLPVLRLVDDYSTVKALIEKIDQELKKDTKLATEQQILVCDILHAYNDVIFGSLKSYLSLRQKFSSSKNCIAVIRNFRANLSSLNQQIKKRSGLPVNALSRSLRRCLTELTEWVD